MQARVARGADYNPALSIYHDVLSPHRQASPASERTVCGGAVLQDTRVSRTREHCTHTRPVSAAAHVAHACGCALASSSRGKEKIGSFFLCILTRAPQASAMQLDSVINCHLVHQLPVYGEQLRCILHVAVRCMRSCIIRYLSCAEC
jgi:hypothetical protein